MHTVTHRDTHTVSSNCWLWNSCWVERALYVFEQWECSLHKYLIISGLLSVWKCIIRLVRITRQEDRAREKEQKGRGRVGKQKRSINCQSGVDTQLKAHHLNMSFIKKHLLHSTTTVPSRLWHPSFSSIVMPHHVRTVGVWNIHALFQYIIPQEPHRRSAV